MPGAYQFQGLGLFKPGGCPAFAGFAVRFGKQVERLMGGQTGRNHIQQVKFGLIIINGQFLCRCKFGDCQFLCDL